MNRREFAKSLLGTIASYSLLETLFTRDAFAGAVKPVTDSWIRDLDTMSRDLRSARIAPALWQAKVKDSTTGSSRRSCWQLSISTS